MRHRDTETTEAPLYCDAWRQAAVSNSDFHSKTIARGRAWPEGAASVPSVSLWLFIAFISLTGCGSPNKANVELRKQNQQLQAKIDALHRQVETSQAEIAGLREKQGTLPTLPADRLQKLVTVASVRLGKLTGGSDLDPSKPGEEGLKVYLTPYDENGDKIKCAGSFEIDAFDLNASEPGLRLGHWTFDSAEAGKHWISFLTEYNYALPLPWQDKRPSHDQVTIRVMFTDELTGRKFTEQTVGKVQGAEKNPTTTRSASK